MSNKRLNAVKWLRAHPKCVFCYVSAEPSIIFYIEQKAIRGWRCPKCGFTLIHPREIPKAMEFLKEAMELKI